jgi:hypothetical protein
MNVRRPLQARDLWVLGDVHGFVGRLKGDAADA